MEHTLKFLTVTNWQFLHRFIDYQFIECLIISIIEINKIIMLEEIHYGNQEN